MKRILNIVITAIALAVAAIALIWRFAPPGIIERLTGKSGPAKILLCRYPVQVRGDAMAPLFQNGERVTLSKCINDRGNIAIGTVILYDRPGGMKLSVIREKIEDADGIRYLVSPEARQSEVDETRPDRILAVYGN